MPTDRMTIDGTIPCIRTLRSAFGCTGCSGRHKLPGSPMILSEIGLQQYAVALIGHFGLQHLHIPDSLRVSVPGWPDLVIWGGKELLARELKRQGETLSDSQRLVAAGLLTSGVNFRLWQPSDLYRGTIERQLMEVLHVH